MLNLKLFTKLSVLLFSLSALNATYAQAPTNFQARQASSCPSNYDAVSDANLCVTNAFSRDAYTMQNASGKCKNGYARIPGLPFCVLNKKSLHLENRDGVFIVSKSEKSRCKASFRKATKARFCVDKRLALLRDGLKLKLENMAKVDCAETDIAGTKVCKSVCQLGFLKSLGKGMCVQWELAENGHAELAVLNQNCSSKYWRKPKDSDQVLCMPKHNVTSIINRDLQEIQAEQRNGTRCGGGIPQVITVAVAGPPPGNVSTANAQAAHTGIREFKMIPVVACSAPEWIRLL